MSHFMAWFLGLGFSHLAAAIAGAWGWQRWKGNVKQRVDLEAQ